VIGTLQLAAALLLVGAGAAKLRAPDQVAATLRRAWRAVRRPGTSRALARASGAVEVVVGVAVIASGSRIAAALLGCCYLAFLAIATRLLRGGQRTSCGCFGTADSPVGTGHVAVNAIAIGIAVAALVRPPGRVGGLFADNLLHGVVGLAQAGLLAYLGFLSITALPVLLAARRRLLEAP